MISLGIFVLTIAIPTALSDPDNSKYRNCSQLFDCVTIRNISYPFWDQKIRPEYCGHPDFELRCDSSAPEMKILSQTFKVLDISPKWSGIIVTSTDYYGTICPSKIANITIDFNIFQFGSNVQNLSLYYGCPFPKDGLTLDVTKIIECEIGGKKLPGYWENTLNDTTLTPAVSDYLSSCEYSALVPVTRSVAQETNTLTPLLDNGFCIQFEMNTAICQRCVQSGGACGSNSGNFACFCTDGGTYDAYCGGRRFYKHYIIIGITVGCSSAVIVILFLVCLGRIRKKKMEKLKTKEAQTPPPKQSIDYKFSCFNNKMELENDNNNCGVRIFSYTELEEATDHFGCSNQLGDGGYGVVYYGKLNDGRAVAVKCLYERNFKTVEQFMNEVEILTRLRHPNLVTLYGCTSKHSRDLLLVYEYIPNGTLADHLHGPRASPGSLTWPIRLSIALDTADALAYLHASDIIHRDVKTNNILLDANFNVKVADFGLSRLFPNDATHVSTAPQGTPGYVDPEYYRYYRLTDKSDVYSFGVVLVELMSSMRAVDTARHRRDVNLANMAVGRIQSHSIHEIVDPCIGFESDGTVRSEVKAVAELAFRCLQEDRDARPSMNEAVEVLRKVHERRVAFSGSIDKVGDEGMRVLKRGVQSCSPNSVVNVKWVSNSITPNSF